MKTQTNIFLLAIITIVCQSCTRYVYVPNMQNVPLLKEKNEARMSVTLNNFQAAYGLSKNIGVMLNAHFPNSKLIPDLGEDISTKRRFYEAGIGYFKEVGEFGVFEIYGGAGIGSLSFDNRMNAQDKFSSKFSRYFIQPSFGWTMDNLDLAFSLRYSRLNFYDLDTSQYEFMEAFSGDQNLSQIDKSSYSFIEPAITLRIGMKYAKSFLQVQRAALLSSTSIEHRDIVYNFGVHVNISKMFKKESTNDILD